MTIISENDLQSVNINPNNTKEIKEFCKSTTNNIEKINAWGTGRKDITGLNIQRFTDTGFTIEKLNGLIQYIGFNSLSAISGTFSPNDLEIGTTFYLMNENETPVTDTITIALGSRSILNSVDTSIILNSSNYITALIYIAEDTFLAHYISTIKP